MIARRLALLLAAVFLFSVFLSAQNSAARTVDLKAPDGVMLKASYFPAAKPGPGVLLLHQCNRQRKVWDDLAAQLNAAGIHVLTFDLRGFGESEGKRYDTLTPQEDAAVERDKWPGDIEVAYNYLVAQPDVKRDTIGVGGASCGVNNSIQTARRHPAEVKSLVLLSGGTDYAGRQFLRQGATPALFAVAEDDEFRPTVQVMPWLYSVDGNPGKRFLHFDTGGHGSDIFKLHPDLRATIVDWFVETLIRTPGKAAPDKNPPAASKQGEILNQIESPGGAAQVAAQLTEARKKDPAAVLYPEAIANLIGYDHMLAGDTKGSVEIMKLNAMAFPDSANTYDSLADAYLADGQKDLALENAKKCIAMLANDKSDAQRKDAIRASAEQKLKQLGEGK
jgi:dienelactone hydrolase